VVALVTLNEAKAWMSITDSAQDTQITDLITKASAAVEDYLDRPATSQASTELYDGLGGRRLFTSRWPITAVSSILIDGQAVASGTFVFQGRMIQLRSGTFTLGELNVEVTYTAGWTTLPDEVRTATLMTLQAMLFGTAADPNLVSESAGGVFGGSFISTGPGSIPPAARSYLDSHLPTFMP
jgi:hypothetical protein